VLVALGEAQGDPDRARTSLTLGRCPQRPLLGSLADVSFVKPDEAAPR
jgi:hypothetical protein